MSIFQNLVGSFRRDISVSQQTLLNYIYANPGIKRDKIVYDLHENNIIDSLNICRNKGFINYSGMSFDEPKVSLTELGISCLNRHNRLFRTRAFAVIVFIISLTLIAADSYFEGMFKRLGEIAADQVQPAAQDQSKLK